MKRIAVVLALVACGKSKQEAPPSPPPPGSGSAIVAKPVVDAAVVVDAVAAAAVTPEDRARKYEECWSYFNGAKYDDFKHCFTDDGVNDSPGLGGDAKPDEIIAALKDLHATFPDIKGDPQLVMVSGNTVVGFALLTGTQQGPMDTPTGKLAPTKERIGILMGAVIDTDDTGRAKRESDYFDFAELTGQLKADAKHAARAPSKSMDKIVLIAHDTADEKSNLAAYKKLNEAWSKHDAKAFADGLADDVVWSEQAEPKDQTKKEVVDGSQNAWKSMTDLKLVPQKTWAAGDYVAAIESFEGTNDGPIPDMGIAKATGKKIAVPTLSIYKLVGGKVKRAWIFYQSLAMVQQLGLMPSPKSP